MIFKSAFDVATRYVKSFSGESRTKQSFKNETDIGNIVRKHAKTGLLEHVNRFSGDYGDYLNVTDYQTSVNQVMAANDMFLSLPSSLRKRFDNDPGSFLNFVSDESNRDEMRELGLLNPEIKPVSEPVIEEA